MKVKDDFSTDYTFGKVLGTNSSSGHVRQGVDVEKTLAIDNKALRIRPLITPGWNRSGLSYGPFPREAGLALSVWMLNGHNTSEGNDIGETLRGRFFRWLRGSGSEFVGSRLLRWAISSQKRESARQFYRWIRNRKGRFGTGKSADYLKENLAVGWFTEASPTDASRSGQAIVVRADGPEVSALCSSAGNGLSPAFKGLQNLQVYYVVLLRSSVGGASPSQGAAYYAASLPDAYGLSAYPHMRLVGIDATPQNEQGADEKSTEKQQQVYAGIHQSALGQVGFRVDTRVYGLRAEVLPELSGWYGTAHCADSLIGTSDLHQSLAELGGSWHVLTGSFKRIEQGLQSQEKTNLAFIKTAEPVGAIHLQVNAGKLAEAERKCKVLWRAEDASNHWALSIEATQCTLRFTEDNRETIIATDTKFELQSNAHLAILILDQGDFFSLYLNGSLLFDRWMCDRRLQTKTKIGIASTHSDSLTFQYLEAHPRNIPIPEALKMGAPWNRKGSQTVIADSFSGEPQDLNERLSEVGQQAWRKEMGSGYIALTGSLTAQVQASAQMPNPNRLAYTVGWPHLDFAEVSVDILPPGTQRRQREKGRGGLIFWQDANNYLIISQWLDDSFHSASLCAFFRVEGFEEVYDAVWSNVGDRITWGQPHQLTVAFDGLHFACHINNEPVLYRSLQDIYPNIKRLLIQRVGIVANWDWGNDTGTAFSDFVAKK